MSKRRRPWWWWMNPWFYALRREASGEHCLDCLIEISVEHDRLRQELKATKARAIEAEARASRLEAETEQLAKDRYAEHCRAERLRTLELAKRARYAAFFGHLANDNPGIDGVDRAIAAVAAAKAAVDANGDLTRKGDL